MSDFTKSLLAFIRATETGRKDASAYTTIYGHNERKLSKPITSMALDQVIAAGPGWTKAYKSSAAGAYQFMNATLKDLKASEGLTGKETFNVSLQDRLGLALLKRRGLDSYLTGKLSMAAFGNNLAKEWASFPVLTNIKGAHRNVKRGETYYAGDKLNKALVKPEAVEAVLALSNAEMPVSKPAMPPVKRNAPNWLIIVVFVAVAAAIALAIATGGFK